MDDGGATGVATHLEGIILGSTGLTCGWCLLRDVGGGRAAGWVDGGMCLFMVVFFGVVPVAVHAQDIPWLPLWCGELRALGVISVHFCSMMSQDASPTC